MFSECESVLPAEVALRVFRLGAGAPRGVDSEGLFYEGRTPKLGVVGAAQLDTRQLKDPIRAFRNYTSKLIAAD